MSCRAAICKIPARLTFRAAPAGNVGGLTTPVRSRDGNDYIGGPIRMPGPPTASPARLALPMPAITDTMLAALRGAPRRLQGALAASRQILTL